MSATAFTERQRAEIRDSFARSRIDADAESRRLAAATFEQRRAQEAAQPKQFPKKAKRRRLAAVVVEPIRRLDAVPPPNTRMEVTLTRSDLTDVRERDMFDRLYAVCNTEFSTVDVVTHVALIARTVVATQRKADA